MQKIYNIDPVKRAIIANIYSKELKLYSFEETRFLTLINFLFNFLISDLIFSSFIKYWRKYPNQILFRFAECDSIFAR